LKLPMGKVTAQGAGSAVTYARRYSLCAALGIAAEDDDDGNAATEQPKASDKQLNFIDSLLNKKVTEKYTKEALYQHLKQQLGTDKDMEHWTAAEASRAIEILTGKQKQGA